MNYILDTNIITAFNKDNAEIKRRLQEVVLYGGGIFISGIIYYETKRGLLDANATKQLEIFDGFCRKFEILFLDSREVFDRASEIYVDLKQRGELIKDADILIAAMALTENLTLVSDDSDFLGIEGIILLCQLEPG
jgi:tRNA(fMet)-specific endonuclease VapC